MRKVSVIILMICYLAFSSGVIINSHYCMNKLASTQFFSSGSKECGKCGMHMDDAHGCCHDEVKMVKMDDDQKSSPSVSIEFASLKIPVQVPSAFIVADFQNVPQQEYVTEQPPPLLKGQETYLQHCVFRI
ncbi:hypothetical protein LZZ85_14770 [Terrimonas sp. NA20]|uniref:Transmembrane protein n=1 Tax=Terrimonas ginsenosidimutans TaxID=2908004 RepID=A0ABS9KTA9_9BACT|nr:hypothetical protein [Terrimonas ginsenosidimutans]MCG2615561.1 hypothetical protein [Terrimonas ginsenosidimutans]